MDGLADDAGAAGDAACVRSDRAHGMRQPWMGQEVEEEVEEEEEAEEEEARPSPTVCPLPFPLSWPSLYPNCPYLFPTLPAERVLSWITLGSASLPGRIEAAWRFVMAWLLSVFLPFVVSCFGSVCLCGFSARTLASRICCDVFDPVFPMSRRLQPFPARRGSGVLEPVFFASLTWPVVFGAQGGRCVLTAGAGRAKPRSDERAGGQGRDEWECEGELYQTSSRIPDWELPSQLGGRKFPLYASAAAEWLLVSYKAVAV